MSTWSDMVPAQRNHLIGELIGAAPLSQCYLSVDGKRVRATPYPEEKRGQVEAMLIAFRASPAVWEEFKRQGSDVQDDWREKLTLDIHRWHIRYSDTPGGAWNVIEWLRLHDYIVTVECHGLGWDFKANLFRTLGDAENVNQEYRHTGTDFPRNVCELLLKIKAPEVLA